MTENKRKSLIVKIRSLLALNVENGCTEAEALSAAEKAQQLMIEYDLSYSDINDIKEEIYGDRRTYDFSSGSDKRVVWHEVRYCSEAIGNYFDCLVTTSNSGTINIFGTKEDTQFVHDMLTMVKGAMDKEWEMNRQRVKYMAPGIHGKKLRTSFLIGMTNRIAQRINSLKEARTAEVAKLVSKVAKKEENLHTGEFGAGKSTCTSLVEMKQQVLNDKYQTYLKQKGIKIRELTKKSSPLNAKAYEAGTQSGNKVKFNDQLN